jgi:virginiamycin A acetyltransferase
MPLPDAQPDPKRRYPVTLPDGPEHKGTVFLSRAIDHGAFEVGEYTYASDFNPPQDWAGRLAPYLFANSREKLRIGRFCLNRPRGAVYNQFSQPCHGRADHLSAAGL